MNRFIVIGFCKDTGRTFYIPVRASSPDVALSVIELGRLVVTGVFYESDECAFGGE